jgi:HK97 family phage prohead protease
MEFLTCFFETKASPNDDEGIIRGYGSVFGNIDSCGDIVAPGAVKKTVEESKSGAKSWPAMLLQHGDGTADGQMPIGLWTSIEEDNTGLRLEGKLANTERGREAYALLKMQPRPALNGLSIGFRAKDYELHGKGRAARRTLKAIDLVECSLVTFPANRLATVTGVKAELEAAPEMTMRDLAWMDFVELRRLMNSNGR